jgi:nucleotide-binding universal stress UspA family protein
MAEETETQSLTSTADASPAFADILCAIDCSRASFEGARQASVLASDGARLCFVCVASSRGVGLAEQTTITDGRADTALARAVELAKDAGAQASAELVHDPKPADALLREAAGYDLLVVGSHGLSRRAGILLGSVASTAAHRGSTPVLIARRPPYDDRFPRKLLVASDGSPGSMGAAEIVARIAGRHDSSVLLVHATDDEDADHRHALAEQTAFLQDATGTEPTVVTSSEDPYRLIVALADREQVSLIVIGSRGLGGIKALGSVSERVAHEAHCSVLIAREPLQTSTTQRR